MRTNNSTLRRWSFRPDWRELPHYASAIFMLLFGVFFLAVAAILRLLYLEAISMYPLFAGIFALIYCVVCVAAGIYYQSGSSQLVVGQHSAAVVSCCFGVRCRIRRYSRELCRFRIVVFKTSLYVGPLIELRIARTLRYLGYGCSESSLQQFISAVG